MALFDTLQTRFSTFIRSKQRPPLEGFYIYFFTLLLGYSAADLSILYFRPEMLPEKAPPAKPFRDSGPKQKLVDAYKSIDQRNIFNSDGKIPPALSEEGSGTTEEDTGVPVASNLPLKLLGTIVVSNKKDSVATISKNNETEAYKTGEEIEGLAKIIDIVRRKVIFRNLSNRRLEYIEMPEESKLSLEAAPKGPVQEIEQVGKTDFTLNRNEVEKYLENLPDLLKPDVVRMLPNSVNGEIQGFRFNRIGAGSVYEKLGFKVGDILKDVNGEPLDDFSKGLELFERLKSSNNIELRVERNGQEETFRYTIN